MEIELQKGNFFKHTKTGKVYRIAGVAEHTETGEELVIYYRRQMSQPLFAMPKVMFLGELEDGHPRFEYMPGNAK